MAPQGLADSFAAPELLLAADDEWVTGTHVENDHDAAGEGVAARLRLCNQRAPGAPTAGRFGERSADPKLELDPAAHLAVRVLDAARVADDARDEECGHA